MGITRVYTDSTTLDMQHVPPIQAISERASPEEEESVVVELGERTRGPDAENGSKD